MANDSSSGGYLAASSPEILEGDNLLDVFGDAIAGITALDRPLVRPKWQPKEPPMPAASVDWCAFGVTESNAENPYIVHDPNADGGQGADVLARQKKVSVLASFYGPNARAMAQRLEDGICIPQNLELLQNNSISFVSSGTLSPLPESINMQWIMRYDLVLYFRRIVSRTYAIRTIASAGVELHVDDKVSEINVNP